MTPLRALLIGFLCTTLLLFPAAKARADLIEYALVVALIALAATAGLHLDLPPGSQAVFDQLDTTVESARAANMTIEVTHCSDECLCEIAIVP